MASERLKVISNFLRNKKGFSRPNKVRLNGMASEQFKVTSNFLRNKKGFSRS